jgi:hypothetical protein
LVRNSVQKAIDYCLRAEDISMDDVSAIVSSDALSSRVRDDLQTGEGPRTGTCNAAALAEQ